MRSVEFPFPSKDDDPCVVDGSALWSVQDLIRGLEKASVIQRSERFVSFLATRTSRPDVVDDNQMRVVGYWDPADILYAEYCLAGEGATG